MKYTTDKNILLIEFLKEIYPDSPASRIKKILSAGKVRVHGKSVTHHAHRLLPGDTIEISKSSPHTAKAPFKFLYEDDFILAIEKPPGINTSSADNTISCASVLTTWYQEYSNSIKKIFVIHRLDREVSGVLLFAKSEDIMEKIRGNWETTEKRYRAVLEGSPPEKSGTYTTYLAENERQRMYSASKDTPGAKKAITQYRIIRKLGKYTEVEIILHTGRKNQIRVHMKEMGCPIVGDRRYGAEGKYIRRIRLHSIMLELNHPVSGKRLKITSEIPAKFYVIRDEDEDYK
ncbi:MAG: RluA family pseudouridine synthase [Deltaproteobacteria bacterium]|nr:RluA family pseudouridine synthase [Deltaproteobacteria bacterium]